MSFLSDVRERLRTLLFRAEEERDLDDELRFHLEMETEKLVAGGVDPGEARRRALLRLGGVDRVKEDVREARGLAWIEDGVADVRYAVRRMRRAPVLAAGIVLSAALGIGANGAVFGVLDRLLLRPPAHIREPGRVKRLVADRYLAFLGRRWQAEPLSFPDFEALSRARAFSRVGAYVSREMLVGSGEDARRADAVLATHEFFALLGVTAARGRFFTAGEDARGTTPAVVLSYGFWQRAFGADEGVLGRTVDLGEGPWPIVGVAPQGFTGVNLEPVDLWLPLRAAGERLMSNEWFTEPTWTWLRIVGRLAPDADADGATAEATLLHRFLHREAIAVGDYDADARVAATPLLTERGPLASSEGRVAKWLGAVSVLVLMIVCANIANLLLARAVQQRRELGVRLALGCSRNRLARQLLTEVLVLSLLGGLAALLVAGSGGSLLRATLFPDLAWHDAVLNRRTVAFVLGAGLVAGVVAGLTPSLRASYPGPVGLLRATGSTATRRGGRTRDALTVLQVALSLVLLAGAGLLVKSFRVVSRIDLGLDPDGVLLVEPAFREGTPAAAQLEFFARASEDLHGIPGVTHASASVAAPFVASRHVDVYRPGGDSVPLPSQGGPYVYAVEPDFFDALRLGIVQGRGVAAADIAGSAPVVVVNRTMARWLWPASGALGRCIRIGAPDAACATVVGVAEDAHRHSLDEPSAAQYYVPLAQGIVHRPPSVLVIRVAGDPGGYVPGIRRALHLLSPDLRFADVRPMQQRLEPQERAWRFGAVLFGALGLLALGVAAVGLYAMLALAVTHRVPELGLRSALGARPRDLVRLVLGQAGRLVGAGIILGLLVAVPAGPAVRPLLYGVQPYDPVVVSTVIGVLLIAGLFAGGIPAWRAARVDPQAALRAE